MSVSYDTIEVAEVMYETPDAVLLDVGLADLVWVPKSVIEDADEIVVGSVEIELNIATWFCRKEEIE